MSAPTAQVGFAETLGALGEGGVFRYRGFS